MKKISAIIGFLLAGFLLWYLIIKPYDYLVTFKVKTSAGTINQTIKLWNTSLENSSPIQQDNLANLTQQIKIKDSTYNYDCSSLGEFKPDWAAFKAANGGLGIAKTDVEGLKTLMDTQVAASYSVQDAIELGDAIKKASESFSAARDTIRDTFSGCPCNDACPAS